MRLVGLIHPVARLLEVCVECSLKNDRRRKVSLSLRKIPSGEAADPSRLWREFEGMSLLFWSRQLRSKERHAITMIPLRCALRSTIRRQPILHAPRRIPQLSLRFYSASLKPEEYHRVADETMDRLTSELEDLLEGNNVEGSDVEYSV